MLVIDPWLVRFYLVQAFRGRCRAREPACLDASGKAGYAARRTARLKLIVETFSAPGDQLVAMMIVPVARDGRVLPLLRVVPVIVIACVLLVPVA